jgi:hypothetical protein
MTVLLVDDHGSFRTAARKLLEHRRAGLKRPD